MYLWIKAFHIVLMTSWMAGIFYLPRIFVHAIEGDAAGQDISRLRIMARKLFIFMTIMAVLTLLSGGYLAGVIGFSGGWLHAKLLLVAGLIAFHVTCWHYLRRLEAERLQGSSLFFRLYNECALLLFVPIVILVVVRPF